MKCVSRNNNNVKRIVSLVLMTLLIFGSFSSCKEKQVAEITYEHFVPLTEIKEGQKNIYLIVKNTDNNYWNDMREYVKQEAIARGCNLYWSGSRYETEWEAQRSLVEEACEEGADAIILAPDDSAKLSEKVSEVYNNGMPIILIDTALTTNDYSVCYMTDNLIAGQKAAEEMLQQLRNKGYTEADTLNVAIQVGSSASQTLNERLAGFSQYWINNAPVNWGIIDEVKVNSGDIELAIKNADDFVKDYDNVCGFFGCNNGSTVGFARYIKENERHDMVMIGFDYSDDMKGLILDDSYVASTMLQRQKDMGSMSIDAALLIIDGGEYGYKFYDTGVVVVNSETIYSDEVKAIIEE